MADLDLQRQREAIRRSLLRANAYAIAILALVIGLAIAGLVQATRADRERNRATAAEQDAREKLWESYLGQAQGRRASVQAGRRFESLEVLRKAAAMRPSLDLRNEAIACLTLADLRLVRPPFLVTNSKVCVDSVFQQYARTDSNGAVQVRTLADDQLLAELPSQNKSVELIPSFSPDGKFLVVYYQDGQMRLWNVASKEVIVTVRPDRADKAFDFSPDSKTWLVIDKSQSLGLYDTGTGELLRKMPPEQKWRRARFSPDGRQIAISSDEKNTAQILDAATWQVVRELPHANGVGAAAWSGDGALVATACRHDGKVYLWRTNQAAPVLVLQAHQAAAIEVDFHPSGQFLASSGWDGATRLWDLTTGELLVHLPETGDLLRFSRDGRYLTAIWGPKDVRLWICEVASERICRLFAKSTPTLTRDDPLVSHFGVAFSPDDQCLAAATMDGVRLWDVRTGRHIIHLPSRTASSVVFDAQRKLLISSGQDGVLSWSMDALADCSGNNPPAPEKVASGSFQRACMDINGEALAYVGGSHVYLSNPRQVLNAMYGMSFVSISPDSRWIAAAAWYGNGGRLWERSTGKVVRDFEKGRSVGVKFTPDSKELIVCAVEDFSFWNVETGQRGRSIPRRNTGGMFGMLAYSADGVLACAHSRTDVQLLEANSHSVLAQLQTPNPQAIADLTFNSAGNHLAVATATPFLQLWDVKLMRQQLAALGLDWGQPVPVPALSTRPAHKNNLFLVLTLSGVALSICLAVSVLNRQRKLMASYRQIDELAVQRSQELERAQAELLHGEKMRALGTLAAGIAHDFNNLLSVIRMANQLVERAVKPSGVTKENTAAIEHAVVQGQQIVRSMLGYSRTTASDNQSYSLNLLVSETVALLSKQFLSGIVLTFELDPKTPPVTGNKIRLEQILLNLIVNAAEAMTGNGKLRVTLRPNADPAGCILAPRTATAYIELAVADSGPGIAPEILPRIFEPFFTTKTVGATPGAGLGLSTVYTIAQQDGLGLGVSTEVGRGSTFRVIVPVK
jgi:signal transduction histidine kinase/Tol biopolymer transport system component